jgi:hypothetical protein
MHAAMTGQDTGTVWRRTLQAIFARWLHAANKGLQKALAGGFWPRTPTGRSDGKVCLGVAAEMGGGWGVVGQRRDVGKKNLLSSSGMGLFASPANMSRVRFMHSVTSAFIVTGGKAGPSGAPSAMLGCRAYVRTGRYTR